MNPEAMGRASDFSTSTREAHMSTATALTPEAMLAHWQGHRALTRRVIEAFPDDQLFSYTIGGMRPFGEMAMEMLTMAEPMVRGVVTQEAGCGPSARWRWRC
jgi:hypothetical protein